MFNVGDKARIRERFPVIKPLVGNPGIIDEMYEFEGKEVTILFPWDQQGNSFRVNENSYIWHSDWLEEMNNFEIESDDILQLING